MRNNYVLKILNVPRRAQNDCSFVEDLSLIFIDRGND